MWRDAGLFRAKNYKSLGVAGQNASGPPISPGTAERQHIYISRPISLYGTPFIRHLPGREGLKNKTRTVATLYTAIRVDVYIQNQQRQHDVLYIQLLVLVPSAKTSPSAPN